MTVETPRNQACSESRPEAKTAPKISAATAPTANAFNVIPTALIRSTWTWTYSSHSHFCAENWPVSVKR